MSTPLIQWYPGHIAKAEKELNKSLDKVDLVIEVRDARIPLATSHPCLQKWIKNKKHLLDIILSKSYSEIFSVYINILFANNVNY